MKIVPLDSEKRYILDCFLQLTEKYPGTIQIYKRLYEKVKKNGNSNKTTKSISHKISRIFLDIYKRICIKLQKKNPQAMYFSVEMETKAYLILRYYEQLTSKDIFLRLCHRYAGNKELGKVTEQQEIQFYEEINTKVKEKFEKKDKADFSKDSQESGEKFIKGKLVLFGKGTKEYKESQNESNKSKIEKFWKKKLETETKEVESEKLKSLQTNEQEEINIRIEAQKKSSETNRHQEQSRNDDYEIKLQLTNQESSKAEDKKYFEENFPNTLQEKKKTKKRTIPIPSKKPSEGEIEIMKDPKKRNSITPNQDAKQLLQLKNGEKPRKIRKPVENE